MFQYDYRYIDTTRDYGVSFLAKQWDLHPVERELETRIMVNSADREELDRDNDYTTRSRESVVPEDYYDLLQSIDQAKPLVDGYRELSEVKTGHDREYHRRRLLRRASGRDPVVARR